MIIPSNQTFKYIANVEFDFRFQYLIGPETSVNSVNLTGYIPAWTVVYPSGSTTYGLVSSGNSGVIFGGQTSNPATGIIDLILLPSATSELPYKYTFSLTPPSGTEIPLLFGSMINDSLIYT